MKPKALLRIFGRSVIVRSAVLALALSLGGCLYGFQGGGGFPSHIRTVYIAPFENQTNQFDIDQEIARQLSEALPRSLGVRLAGEQAAEAIVRGRITRYDDVARNYVPGETTQVLQHQVEISVAIEMVDVRRNEILWDSPGVIGRGEYRPDSQPDRVGRTQAVESLVRQIIDGAQSQW